MTVYNGTTPSVSTPTSVTVYPLPTATITASGPTSFCTGGSVTLTANSNSAYSWTPLGQTSQSVVVNTSGTYNVTVTNSNGCTKTATAVSVSVSNCGGTCPPPTGLATTYVSATSAALDWAHPNTGQTEYNVKLVNMNTGYSYITGKVPYTTTALGVGVSSSTNYKWYVRSWCGTTSSVYAGYLSFTTPSVRISDPTYVNDLEIEELFPDPEADVPGDNVIFLNADEVQLYPNPASTFASLTFKSQKDQSVTVSIMEANGRLVRTTAIDAVEGFNIYDLNLENLTKGM